MRERAQAREAPEYASRRPETTIFYRVVQHRLETWLGNARIHGPRPAARGSDCNVWVYFGTGDLNNPLNSSQNRFYGLKDITDMSNGSALTEASLVDVTTVDGSGGNGWYLRLASDERVFTTADVFDGVVFFTTFLPEEESDCDSRGGGPATLYAVESDSGYAALSWPTGERLEESDSSKTRSTVVGSGIPSNPLVVTAESDGVLKTSVVTGTTDQQLADQPAPPINPKEILYWREVY